jgi:hypothetical protein
MKRNKKVNDSNNLNLKRIYEEGSSKLQTNSFRHTQYIFFSSFQGQANAVGLSQVNDIFLRLVVCSGCFFDNKQAFTSFSKLHDDKKSSTQFSR